MSARRKCLPHPSGFRVGRQFSAGRKLGKTHQNVLVFVKGDPKTATAARGPVEVALPDEAATVLG